MTLSKMLIVPMSAMAKTSGPFSRAVSIVKECRRKNIKVAICAAQDVNFKAIPDVKCFELSAPTPMGLPTEKAKFFMNIGMKLGLPGRKTIHSFEEVLFITGALKYSYLKKSVEEIRAAIKDFSPDVVYSEFNISAIIAAICEGKKICCSYSYPARSEFAKSPQFSKGLNKLLGELGLEKVDSALDLFKSADLRFVPSIPELEPIKDAKTFYCGSMKPCPEFNKDAEKNKILVYMGVGTIPQSKLLKEVPAAFRDTSYQIYISGTDFDKTEGNIHFGRSFDFKKLFPETFLYLNHGGQNSIADALIYGVPEIIYPGKVFERVYNAKSVQDNSAGVVLKAGEFKREKLKAALKKIESANEYRENAIDLGEKLLLGGGAKKIIETIKSE